MGRLTASTGESSPGENYDEEPVFIDEDRTFFCSELVAKAYKVLGIIPDDDVACSRYFPASFSSSSTALKFNPGLSLEGELSIVVGGNSYIESLMQKLTK